ncbi:MAG: hypothetical protein EZS28_050070, partial [Streblomastix strix]
MFHLTKNYKRLDFGKIDLFILNKYNNGTQVRRQAVGICVQRIRSKIQRLKPFDALGFNLPELPEPQEYELNKEEVDKMDKELIEKYPSAE